MLDLIYSEEGDFFQKKREKGFRVNIFVLIQYSNRQTYLIPIGNSQLFRKIGYPNNIHNIYTLKNIHHLNDC